MSDFNRTFTELDAPDYPATCDNCGEEGTNATIVAHVCKRLTETDHHLEITSYNKIKER